MPTPRQWGKTMGYDYQENLKRELMECVVMKQGR